MAEFGRGDDAGLVIELGAGAGVITESLLESGVRPGRLLVFERSELFCEILKNKFENVRIIQDNAVNIASYIPKGEKIDCIVSSLPFASFERSQSERIVSTLKNVIGGGRLIQYTYLLAGEHSLERSGFQRLSSAIVWLNLPPAKVLELSLPKG